MRAARAAALLLLCLATPAAFWPVLNNGFVNWDDAANFRDNFSYRGLGWAQLQWMWTTFHMGHYQPLSWMSLGLDFLVWGMNPFGYHLTNLLLHMMNGVLFFFVALRLLRSSRGAIFAALVFALHPLRVESVAWVTERRDVLSGAFYLATILFYLRRYLRMALLCYLLSLLSKGIGVTLPIALLILDAYPLRRLSQGWPVLREKIPFLAASLLFGSIALLAHSHTGVIAHFSSVGIIERVAISFFATAFYLWKTIAPFHLLPLYARPPHLDVWAWPFLASIGVVLALSLIFFSLRRRWPALLASWGYYLVTILPVLGIVLCGIYLAADRYTYLPCLALALLAGAIIQRLDGSRRVASMVVLSGIVIGLGVLTWRQCRVWHDSKALWGYTLSVDPRCAPAHNNLGTALAREGRTAEAVAQFQAALDIDPDYAEAHNNLGTAWARDGKPAPAAAEYRLALAVDPAYAMARDNLGAALMAQGRLDEAIIEYQQALQVNPNDAHAHNNLGLALEGQGQVPQAIAEFRRALEISPHYAEAAANLRRALNARR